MYLLLPVILLLIILLLISSKTALALATLGLTLWFENMVPTLLPFMLLSGILTGLGLQYALLRPLRGFFKRVFRTTENGAYCIIMGFLCGFPMGAFCVADLYKKGLLGQTQAKRLIPFCNNIGPVYFYSFAIPLLGLRAPAKTVYPLLSFGMYGIPFLYGILQAHVSPVDHRTKTAASEAVVRASRKRGKTPDKHISGGEKPSLLTVVDEAIASAGRSMLRLCGYMILFNILMLPLYALHVNGLCSGIVHAAFEISGGIRVLQGFLTILPSQRQTLQLIMLTALSFGGLCCAGQSYAFMNTVGLSPLCYLRKRLAIAFAAGLFYAACFFSGLIY